MIYWLCLSLHLVCLVNFGIYVCAETSVTTNDVVFIIRNQNHKTSISKANDIKKQLETDALALNQPLPDVLMLHEDWAPRNGWTVLPLLPLLQEKFQSNKQKKWFYFCEDTTKVSLKGLLNVLSEYDPTEEQFIGHALYDPTAAIIHHFIFYKNPSVFPFPDFDAGWVISRPLLERAVKKINAEKRRDFSIDVKHEIAMFFSNQKPQSQMINGSIEGILLRNDEHFCVNKPLDGDQCVSTVNYEEPNCGSVENSKILISVKTCTKYHEKRVPIIKETLGKYAKNIRYYSDTVDKSIPTEYAGVKNTESGHCQKLFNIIARSNEGELKKTDWLVVVDDDTIMSFKRLQKLLACYDPSEPIILGERYGYIINIDDRGYDYPTGGGGMVLSRRAVENILKQRICRCSSDDAPDDMWLGQCSRHMKSWVPGFRFLHTNSFHQAHTREYSKDFLSHHYLVSFHKHYGSPMQLYNDYLRDDDDDVDDKRNDGRDEL